VEISEPRTNVPVLEPETVVGDDSAFNYRMAVPHLKVVSRVVAHKEQLI